MNSQRGYTAVVLVMFVCLLAMSVAGCDVAPVPGRFTYIVKYEVTSATVPNATITYDNAAGTGQGGLSESLPWSSEDLASPDFEFTYDYANPFVPMLNVQNPSLPAGESITFSIILKDYRVDFQEQVLESMTITNTTVAPLAVDETLFAPPLPQ
jgi:hypothetical protein